MTYNEIISALLIEKRQQKTKLAKHLGVARTTLDDYLNGITQMPADKLLACAEFFQVPVGYLFGEDTIKDNTLSVIIKKQQADINKLSKKIDLIAKSLQIDNSIL